MKMIFRSVLVAALMLIFALSPYGAQQMLGQRPLKVLSGPKPDYPADALTIAAAGGTIEVFVEIDRKGKAHVVEAFGPWMDCMNHDQRLDTLRDAAIEAAKNTVFEPILLGGEPVETTATMTYKITAAKLPAKPGGSSEPSKVSFGGAVLNGRATSLPKPQYPSIAREYHVSGQVAIRVVIGEDGRVLTADFSSGNTLFLKASAEAACRAKFSPTLLSGTPVKVTGIITYNFVLEKPAPKIDTHGWE